MTADATVRTIRVMVVEDHDLMREATVRFLGVAADMEVIGAVATMEDALSTVASVQEIDVVILDMKLPGLGGVEGIPLLHRLRPELKVLVLTMLESGDAREVVHHAGADGFLTKGCAPSELVEAVRAVAAGRTVGFAAAATDVDARRPGGPATAPLTADEVAVLRLLLDSKSVGEMAGELSLGVRQVALLVGSITTKTGGATKAAWLRFALDHDLL